MLYIDNLHCLSPSSKKRKRILHHHRGKKRRKKEERRKAIFFPYNYHFTTLFSLHRAEMGNQLTAATVVDVGTCMRELPEHELDVVLHGTRFMKVSLDERARWICKGRE